ncbi:hypothetical protein HPB47_001124 [Ixodes persulcatus]|uniref:Uncharacterized protein n=1 Tax=Ixodes persulcatus TaxID=34615 RepID=A0AC60PQ82_IXOPE|nr:hypothetical protein HPB47_001124 [Ixodes persulcatus]
MLSKHKTRKRYLEPDAAPYEQMPRSTAHRLRIGKSPTGSSSPSLPSSETLPSTGMSDCTSDAVEDSCTEECDTAERESARGSYHSPRVDRPFVEFATPLGNGTSFSVGDALVLIMDYAIEEGLAWSSIEKLLKLQNRLLGTSCLPESKYLFRKFASASPDDITFHFYCPTCETLLEKTTGTRTDRAYRPHARCVESKGSYFVGLPLEAQLLLVLADEDVRQKLVESLANVSAPRSTAKSEVTDGDFYHQQRAKLGCGPHDLTVSMNADGSPIFKSPHYAIWPVQLTLNELPPCLRWRSVILPLLWYGAKHPNMTLLLQAFATQMKGLVEDGITWNADGTTVNSKRAQSGSLVEPSRNGYGPNVNPEVANTGRHITHYPLSSMKAQFSKIHQLFLKHNTAVSSSASVERLFSVAGDVFSRKRGNITDENFYRQLLLKGNDY